MASIHKDRRSQYWIAYFRDSAGKQVARSTKIAHSPAPLPAETAAELRRRRVENERAARLLAEELEEGLRGNRTESQLRTLLQDVSKTVTGKSIDFPTAAEFLERWLEREKPGLTESSFNRYRSTFRKFTDSLGKNGRGDALLADVAANDVATLKSERLTAGIKPSTVRADLKILSIPFAAALREGLANKNPVAAVPVPKDAAETRGTFTPEEIEAMIVESRKSEPEFETLILLGGFAGLRLGDCVKMTWRNVDTAQGTLTVTPEKTRRSKRSLKIPIHPRLLDHLLELTAPESPDALLCPQLATVKSSGRSGLSRRFLNILRRAGVEQTTTGGTGEGRAFNSRTFHSLRHTFVTRLQAANVPPDLRMSLAGHTDAGTHSGYTHTQLETLRAAVAKL